MAGEWRGIREGEGMAWVGRARRTSDEEKRTAGGGGGAHVSNYYYLIVQTYPPKNQVQV